MVTSSACTVAPRAPVLVSTSCTQAEEQENRLSVTGGAEAEWVEEVEGADLAVVRGGGGLADNGAGVAWLGVLVEEEDLGAVDDVGLDAGDVEDILHLRHPHHIISFDVIWTLAAATARCSRFSSLLLHPGPRSLLRPARARGRFSSVPCEMRGGPAADAVDSPSLCAFLGCSLSSASPRTDPPPSPSSPPIASPPAPSRFRGRSHAPSAAGGPSAPWPHRLPPALQSPLPLCPATSHPSAAGASHPQQPPPSLFASLACMEKGNHRWAHAETETLKKSGTQQLDQSARPASSFSSIQAHPWIDLL
ncbi:hypothetical protein DAI22_11g116832 [Oryza sativa Japonica Group]|nr:hypothetical protein DAI22_11g116832 [Oryza sativa Japonica Group]